jgi:hypothetical protein
MWRKVQRENLYRTKAYKITRHFSGVAPRRGRHVEGNPQRLIEVGRSQRARMRSHSRRAFARSWPDQPRSTMPAREASLKGAGSADRYNYRCTSGS